MTSKNKRRKSPVLHRIARRGVSIVRSNETIVKIVKKNPRIRSVLKKIARRVSGDTTSTNVVDEDDFIKNISARAYSDVYNPTLAENFAEHEILLRDNKQYYYEPEPTGEFSPHQDDTKLMAIYLPQFHPFEENNKAWGKGFTEWSNVTAAKPRFVGQQQPVLPSDLGFYDLRIPGKLKEQIDLAKKYGIHGFSFYYYWFSGKKVMEMPIQTFLEHKEWDFNFAICWANENWTKKWDGSDNEIIFEQKNNENDAVKFIDDVAKYLLDPRYITEDGKPVLQIYRPKNIPNVDKFVSDIRARFRSKYKKDLYLVAVMSFDTEDPRRYGFDAGMDFAPMNWFIKDENLIQYNTTVQTEQLLDINSINNTFDYRKVASNSSYDDRWSFPVYYGVSPSWSNEARRKGNGGATYINSSPDLYTHWLNRLVKKSQKENRKYIFINAWNEWAEGAMLEPSTHLGHNTLLRTAEVLALNSKNKVNQKNFTPYAYSRSKDSKLAVIVHAFYTEQLPIITSKLKRINVKFDLYITVPSDQQDVQVEKISSHHGSTNIIPVPNRGRDVLPFITVATRINNLKYDYILKLHTKKSTHRKDGGTWFKSLLDELIPSDIATVFDVLGKKDTGAIGPSSHVVSLSRHAGIKSSNGRVENIELLKELLHYNDWDKSFIRNNLSDTGLARNPYFGGTMFWCRADLLDPLVEMYLMPSDFPSEKGQIDSTLMHSVERLLGMLLHRKTNKKMFTVDADGAVKQVSKTKEYKAKYKYAP